MLHFKTNTKIATTIHVSYLHTSSVVIEQIRKATFSFVLSCHQTHFRAASYLKFLLKYV